METYRRVKQQIAELEKKAAQLRRIEAANVIADIKKKIAKFELQPEDLFDSIRAAGRTLKAATPSVIPRKLNLAPKYRDPASGSTWSGHGRAPAWIMGKDRETFLIDGPKKPAPAAPKAPAKKVSVAPAKSTKPAAKKPVAKKPVAKPIAKPTAKAKPVAPSKTLDSSPTGTQVEAPPAS